MKKALLSLAVVFVMSSFITSNVDAEKLDIETITIEEVGPGRDCVNYASAMTIAYAGLPGGTGDPNDYMSFYHDSYLKCYLSLTLFE